MRTYTFEQYAKSQGISKREMQFRKKWFKIGWDSCDSLIRGFLKDAKRNKQK